MTLCVMSDTYPGPQVPHQHHQPPPGNTCWQYPYQVPHWPTHSSRQGETAEYISPHHVDDISPETTSHQLSINSCQDPPIRDTPPLFRPFLHQSASPPHPLSHQRTSPTCPPTSASVASGCSAPHLPCHPGRRSSPNPSISVSLCNIDLWHQFCVFGNEMIITKTGRRMFPTLSVEVSGLDPSAYYFLLLDVSPADGCRYKFAGRRWMPVGKGEPPAPTRLYLHPDCPALGAHWMRQPVEFHKLKLTNNAAGGQGHMVLHSMHRYQPRVHVVAGSDILSLHWQHFNTFTFPQTTFMAVTAYQNDTITQLKILNNPFAKGLKKCGSLKNDDQRKRENSNGSDDSSEGSESQMKNSYLPPSPYYLHSEMLNYGCSSLECSLLNSTGQAQQYPPSGLTPRVPYALPQYTSFQPYYVIQHSAQGTVTSPHQTPPTSAEADSEEEDLIVC